MPYTTFRAHCALREKAPFFSLSEHFVPTSESEGFQKQFEHAGVSYTTLTNKPCV